MDSAEPFWTTIQGMMEAEYGEGKEREACSDSTDRNSCGVCVPDSALNGR